MIEKINFTYEEAEDQTERFTPNHVKYDCIICYNNHSTVFVFQCNPAYGTPTLERVLDCVISDTDAVDDTVDLADFLFEFGYNDNTDTLRMGIKAYDGCLLNSSRLHRLFTDEEINILRDEVEDIAY